MLRTFIIILISILFLSSCHQRKKVIYLRDIALAKDTVPEYKSVKNSYKIQPGDILYVQLISLDDNINKIYNLTDSRSFSGYQQQSNLYINGFSVRDSGFIDLPIIGKVNVVNKTIKEAKDIIYSKVKKYLKSPNLIVKLVSYKYTLLGEVHRPGSYYNYNDRLTIFEAIGNAGDISDYGNKKNVLVIRPTNNGEKFYRVDLTDINILNSDVYYLLPNDVVYVEPVRYKSFRLNAPNISLVLSSVTTMIIVLNYLNK